MHRNAAAAHLAAIISSSDDAIISKDLNGIVLSWNTAAERLFGYAPHETIGRHISVIIPRERLSEETTVIGQIRAGISLTHYETVRQRKDGSYVDISLTVSPIHDTDGTIVGASKIARDISEQKELRGLPTKRAAPRTISWPRSRTSCDALNTILGYLHMLQRGSIPAGRAGEGVRGAIRNGPRPPRLVDDVLDTSRSMTGKMRVELQPERPGPAHRSRRSPRFSPPPTAKACVETHLDDESPSTTLATRTAWGRFSGTFSNAVKFTPTGGSC